MSMHIKPLTPIEEAGLRAHGLPVGTPSQLADAFRLGMAWADKARAESTLAEEREAAPKAVRLTAPDIVDALRGNGLYEDSRAFQRLFPILEADARAIESAVLRKNGIEVAE